MINILLPAWIAGVLLCFITAPLGAFVVWRGMSYLGDTLSHASLLGIALGVLLQVNPAYTLFFTIILLALCLLVLEKQTDFSIDTSLGILAHSALSLGIIVTFLSNSNVELFGYLFGDILAITYADVLMIAVGMIIICGLLYYYWQELLAITVDEKLAFVDGVNIQRIKTLLMLLLACTIGLSIKFVGALIITALLIIPPATARSFAKTPEGMVGYSILISLFSLTFGLLFSWWYDTPSGPSIVLVSAAFFILSLCRRKI